MSNINANTTTCFFWHEGLGHRGSIEIGSCVFKFLEQVAKTQPNSDVVLYSDNCSGQQKNRYPFTAIIFTACFPDPGYLYFLPHSDKLQL